MRRASTWLLFFALLALAPGGWASADPAPRARGSETEILLLHQGHFRGCLLPRHPNREAPLEWGGVARRAACADSVRATGVPLLLLDAGNFFTRPDRTTDIISVVAWKEMERLGYDAVVLGGAEFANWGLVEYLLAESRLSLVTTNIEVRRAGVWEPLAARDRVLQRGGLRIGILGLTEAADLPQWVLQSRADSLRVLPLAETAARACEGLRGRVDLVIALVAGESDVPPLLPAKVPEIDVIVAGRGVSSCAGIVLNEPEEFGATLGVTRLVVSSSGEIVARAGSDLALTEAYPVDSTLARDAEWVVEQSRRMQEEVRQARSRPRAWQTRSRN